MTKHIIEATLENGVIWEVSVKAEELQEAKEYYADLYYGGRLIDFSIDGIKWEEGNE